MSLSFLFDLAHHNGGLKTEFISAKGFQILFGECTGSPLRFLQFLVKTLIIDQLVVPRVLLCFRPDLLPRRTSRTRTHQSCQAHCSLRFSRP